MALTDRSPKSRDLLPRRTAKGTLYRSLFGLFLLLGTGAIWYALTDAEQRQLATQRAARRPSRTPSLTPSHPGEGDWPPVRPQAVPPADSVERSGGDLPPTATSPTNDLTTHESEWSEELQGTTKRELPEFVAAVTAALDHSVVKIEALEADDARGLGTGFVVDRRGLVATSWHVMAEATMAVARFSNGTAYEIAGYVAVEPELDLAIVTLRDPPADLKPVVLMDEDDPERLSQVVAIGHPRGLEFSPFDGRVSRVLTTTQLPASSQRFLRRMIRGQRDQRWIQHTAAISEGNSGGPLLNERGRVIGVNTWVDRQARFSYALHGLYVKEMLANVTDRIEPLARYARPEAQMAHLLRRLTADRIDELAARARQFDYRPESAEDYEVLQQLAWAITAVQMPADFTRGLLDDRLAELTPVVRRVLADLAARRWDAIGQITIINEHAATQIDQPLVGLFLFATVERVVRGDDGEQGALLRMAGVESTLYVPLDGQLGLPEPNQQCLLLGLNYEGRKLRYGDNPLKLITAHVIASHTLLPLNLTP